MTPPNTSGPTPSRRIAVGITGLPSKLCVSLYDIETHQGKGIDLYFNDVNDLLQTLKVIADKVEAGKDWFNEELAKAEATQ